MSTKVSLSFLVISGVFLSTDATHALVSRVSRSHLVINNTSDVQKLSVDDIDNPQIIGNLSSQSKNSDRNIGNNDNLASANSADSQIGIQPEIPLSGANLSDRNHRVPALEFQRELLPQRNLAPSRDRITSQTSVTFSDVAMLGGNTRIEPKIESKSPIETPETSFIIPVPAPLTQTIPLTRLPKSAQAKPVQIERPATVSTEFKPSTSFDRESNEPGSISIAIYPLATPAPITSRFGWRTHPLTGMRRFHSGIDIGAPMGAPVVATGSGTVVSAGWNSGYGKAVVIQHNGVQQTLYGHLSEVSVRAGQPIAQGTVIGLVGSTGNSTGPHLHFESRASTSTGWTAVDPSQEIRYAMDTLQRSAPFARKDMPPGI